MEGLLSTGPTPSSSLVIIQIEFPVVLQTIYKPGPKLKDKISEVIQIEMGRSLDIFGKQISSATHTFHVF